MWPTNESRRVASTSFLILFTLLYPSKGFAGMEKVDSQMLDNTQHLNTVTKHCADGTTSTVSGATGTTCTATATAAPSTTSPQITLKLTSAPSCATTPTCATTSELKCPDISAYVLDPKYTVAASGVAAQSTTYNNNVAISGPQNALDGNPGTTSHSASKDLYPWWRIDLSEPYVVTGFSILNRKEAVGFRLHDFEVRVGNVDPVSAPQDLALNRLCHFHPFGGIAEGALYNGSCGSPPLGRYLSVQIVKRCSDCQEPTVNYLHMAEVFVYGCKP